ncbi:MAG TPA: ATP-binding protein [Williamwhitmania sp.]|nr:ATP-binding protein [Williamwhitmania sp.]
METKRELEELIVANKNLAEELFITHKELVFQSEETEKRVVELIVANKKLSEELEIAHKKLLFQNEEKAKRAAELILANKELAFQNEEKAKRAAELILANKELVFQNEEKAKRAAELIIANTELAFQAKLDIANNELLNQYAEKAKHAEELILRNNELKQLLQLNADKDRFISILAHDLRGPFNSILGFLDLLCENIHEYDIAKIEKNVNIINDSAQRVHNLLEAILMWTRAESGRLLYKPQVVNLKTTANDILEILKPSANKKSITLNCLVEEELTVVADPEMLKTVLRNLLSNAIKFTHKEGRVSINALQTESNIVITVSDNGIGIAPDIQSMLFDISQVHTTSGTANESGTGLGLLLCKNLVAKHDGIIWVESEEGKGSEFKFTLPIIKDPSSQL